MEYPSELEIPQNIENITEDQNREPEREFLRSRGRPRILRKGKLGRSKMKTNMKLIKWKKKKLFHDIGKDIYMVIPDF